MISVAVVSPLIKPLVKWTLDVSSIHTSIKRCLTSTVFMMSVGENVMSYSFPESLDIIT